MTSKGPTETWAAGSKAAAVRPDEVNREEKTASRCSNRGAQVKEARRRRRYAAGPRDVGDEKGMEKGKISIDTGSRPFWLEPRSLEVNWAVEFGPVWTVFSDYRCFF